MTLPWHCSRQSLIGCQDPPCSSHLSSFSQWENVDHLFSCSKLAQWLCQCAWKNEVVPFLRCSPLSLWKELPSMPVTCTPNPFISALKKKWGEPADLSFEALPPDSPVHTQYQPPYPPQQPGIAPPPEQLGSQPRAPS